MANWKGGPPRPATLEKIRRVDELTRNEWGVVEACAQEGLDVPTYYRHSPRRDVDPIEGLVDVLTALAGKAA